MDNQNNNINTGTLGIGGIGQGQYVPPQHPAPCPSCGHCPTCGRGGQYTQPFIQGPFWQTTYGQAQGAYFSTSSK